MSKLIKKQLGELFELAELKGRIQFVFTLVRVSGYGEGEDKLVSLKSNLEKFDGSAKEIDLHTILRIITQYDDFFALLLNLVNCSNNEYYNSHPFIHLYTGEGFERKRPTSFKIVQEIVNICRKTGKTKLAQLLGTVFNNNVLNFLESEFSASEAIMYKKHLYQLRGLVTVLLELYFEKRLKFKDYHKLHKLPNFQVLELITDENYGLNGFIIYFSNGSLANYIRSIDNTICTNLSLTNQVNFFVGSLEEMTNEYRVGEKRLYEVGLPGRYNKLGEWKPIYYPVSTENLQDEALLISEDGDVQGSYFYMLCTGHRIIEFVVRTAIELPSEITNFGHSFHLWRCPNERDIKSSNSVTQIYDGWIDLDYGSKDEIEAALKSIGLAINIIGFTYGVPIDWRLKYKMIEHNEAIATPTNEDLGLLNNLLKNMPYSGDDAEVLSYALDWYVRGRTSKNIFIRF